MDEPDRGRTEGRDSESPTVVQTHFWIGKYLEKDPSKYVHFKRARLHQENDWRNTNEERRETRSNVVGGWRSFLLVKRKT